MKKSENIDLTQLVLQHVNKPNYQPVKIRVIAKQLKVLDEHRAELKKVIKRLVREGKLKYGDKHLIKPGTETSKTKSPEAKSPEAKSPEAKSPEAKSPEAKSPASEQVASKPTPSKKHGRNAVTGIFRRTSHGYGFVRPSGTSPAAGKSEDIFVPARQTLDATDRDLVIVQVKKSQRGDKDRTSGEIVEVLERETNRFVGTYSELGGVGYVQVDGKLFTKPIAVGDAGAKNAGNSDKVVIEIARFPSHFSDGEGVIIEVLGPRGMAGVDTMTVLREFNLPEDFPEEVLESAREQAAAFEEAIDDGREDLTNLAVITIDPHDARDFDDAISLERLDNGHWLLGVHIADVSHFVPPKTVLDDEARDRATSVYLPDRVIPMLPEIISNNLASLQPDRVRYTKSAFIEMTADGARVATEVKNGAIQSKRRFTYEEVDEFLADQKPWKKKLKPEVFDLLARMHELAMTLRKRRLDGGSIELNLPEIKIDLDKDGRVEGAHLVEYTESHQIIEEFMLSANEAVAELLHDRELYFLRRIHESPDPRKLKTLTSFVRELGIDCESMESRFEIKRVIAEVADQPERHAVNYAILRSMQKAVYSPIEEGHYALASKDYCHFTSPIRRYPDLTVHRLLDALARKKKPANDFDQLAIIGEHCSEREQRATKAERELIKMKLLNFLSKQVGNQLDAVITGVEEFGLFAQGLKLPAEGLIHISSLQDDYYDFDSTTRTITGRRTGNSYRLGDVVRVEVFHVDVDRRELDYRLITRVRKSRPAPRKKKGTPKKEASGRGKPRKKKPSGKKITVRRKSKRK